MIRKVSWGKGIVLGSTLGGSVAGERTFRRSKAVDNSPRAILHLRLYSSASSPKRAKGSREERRT